MEDGGEGMLPHVRKSQTPKPKSQVNSNRAKAKKSKKTRRRFLLFSWFGDLDFAWDLELGIWDFYPACDHFCRHD
jgi:hypothetical protein